MKILIVNNNMQVGGIQKSLVSLLGEISDRHEVTLLLFYPNGELLDDINENVKVIKGNFFTRVLGMSQADAAKEGKTTAFFRGICVAVTKVIGAGFVYRLLTHFHKLSGNFDAAISFMQNSDQKTLYGGCNEFVLNSVKAKRKISFVHCDFKNYPGNNPYNASLYEKFDKIACVSDSVKAVFEEACPKCKDKTATVYNMYDFEYMSSAAEEYMVKKSDGSIMIFTSARISEEKGILRMMPIFANIKQAGGKFIWYIAGYGPEYNKAVQAVKDQGLEENVVFLGLTKNPYPYFKNADMVLVPSYNEAAPMVYLESMFFGTPVFTTNTTSAYEFIDDGGGWIVQNSDQDIENKLRELILCKDEILKMKPCPKATNEKAAGQFEDILR